MTKLSNEAQEWWIRKAEALFRLERSLVIKDGGIMSERQELESRRMSPRDMWELIRETEEMEKSRSGQEKVHDLRQDLAGEWPHPTVMDSWVFLVTEVGEVGDALIRQGYGERSAYVRNNEKRTDLHKELGDVYLMLCTLATHLGVDLDEALDEVIGRLRRNYGIPKFE